MTIPGIYSQRDPRWSGQELGNNTDGAFTIYHYGCLITSVANMLWWNGNPGADPGAVNGWMKANAGFTAGGGEMIWSSLIPLLEQVNMVDRGYSTDIAAIRQFLQDDNNYAIMWLTKPGFDEHWCAAPYSGWIADSWDGQLKQDTSYTFHGAHLYSKIAPPAVVTPSPQPEPAPVAAPVPAPPAPQPVPTNPVPQPNPDAVPTTIPIDTISGGTVTAGVPVSTPAVASPVLADLPPQPEYVETFRHFKNILGLNEDREVHLKEDTSALDMTGVGAPKGMVASRPFRSSGTMTDGGRKYYRGTSGGWYGIPAEDIKEEIPAAVVSGPTLGEQARQILKDPVGALIRFFASFHR